MKNTLKINSDEVEKIHRKEVELVIAKINELLGQNIAKENYEDCARLRDLIPKFEAFLKNVPFSEIKDDLNFAKGKITEHFKDELSKTKGKK